MQNGGYGVEVGARRCSKDTGIIVRQHACALPTLYPKHSSACGVYLDHVRHIYGLVQGVVNRVKAWADHDWNKHVRASMSMTGLV